MTPSYLNNIEYCRLDPSRQDGSTIGQVDRFNRFRSGVSESNYIMYSNKEDDSNMSDPKHIKIREDTPLSSVFSQNLSNLTPQDLSIKPTPPFYSTRTRYTCPITLAWY